MERRLVINVASMDADGEMEAERARVGVEEAVAYLLEWHVERMARTQTAMRDASRTSSTMKM